MGKTSQCGLQLAAPPPPLAFLCLSFPQPPSLQLHLLHLLHPSSDPLVHLSVRLSVRPPQIKTLLSERCWCCPGVERLYSPQIHHHICIQMWRSSQEKVLVPGDPCCRFMVLTHGGTWSWSMILVNGLGPCWSVVVPDGPCWSTVVHCPGPWCWSMLGHAGP